MGLARWTAFESKHGNSIVPDDDPDQQLVRWTKKQQKDYWNWKKGRPAYLGEESFQMLTRFGFDWGEDEDNAVETPNDQPSSETAAKPAAEQTTTQTTKRKRLRSSDATPLDNNNTTSEQTPTSRDSRKKKAATRGQISEALVKAEEPTSEGGESTDTDIELKSASKVTRSLRRSTRQATLPPAPEADGTEASKPAAKSTGSRKRKITQAEAASPPNAALKRRKLPTREASRKQAPKTTPKAAAKTKSGKATGKAKVKASGEQPKTYGTKTLKRLISPEEEEDVPGQIREEFAEILKCDELLESDKDAGVNVQTARFNQHWEERFFDLLVFVKTYGHTLVPKVYTENKALGRFVAKMRNWFKSEDPHLTPSRQKRLEAVDFSWDAKTDPNFWRVQNDTPQASDLWEERFQELLAYKEANGDCMIPKNYPPNQTLARWVSKQRRHFRAKKEGTYHTLDDEKVAKLVEVDFVFETKTHTMIRETVLKRFEGRWDYFFDLLANFKKLHGHCAVPRRWKPDQPLASWVMRQRFQWKKMEEGSHSYLTEERLQRLKDIEFVFQVDRKQVYPIDGNGKSPPATASNSTGRRAKASTPDSELTIDADEEIASSDTEEADSVKSPPAAATKPTGRRAKASTPASELTIDAEIVGSENEDSDGESDKKPAAAIPQDTVDSDGKDDEPVPEEEEEQTEVQEEESPGAPKKGDTNSEVVGNEQAADEVGDLGASDSNIAEEAKVPDEEGSIGAPERGNDSGETAEEKKAPDESSSLGAPSRGDNSGSTAEEKKAPDENGFVGAPEKGDNSGGTVEEIKTSDGADTLLLFASERRDSDDDTLEEKSSINEAEALLLLAAAKGEDDGGTLEQKKTPGDEDNARSAVDAATPGDSTPAAVSKKSTNRRTQEKSTDTTPVAASKKSANRRTKEKATHSTPTAASKKSANRRTEKKATGGTKDEPVSEETHNSEAAGDNMSTDVTPQKEAPSKTLTKLKKGVWECAVCEKDEFEHFIDATAHEAACADLTKLAIPADTQLD
jgi:hypothetical protein